jgi:hypothetical protein
MRLLRRSLVLVPLALLTAGVSPTSASQQLAPPFSSTAISRYCGLDATGASSANCNVSGSASASTGAVSAGTTLISPQGGMAPWSADATSGAFVLAPVYHLSSAVPRLDFTVTIHVNQASVTLRNLPIASESPLIAGLLSRLVDPNMNHWVEVDAFAAAKHAQCSGCVGGTDAIVLKSLVPTSVTASGQDYVLQMSMTNPNGQAVPAGDVTVQAGVGTTVWQGNGPGSDTASVEAVVTGISLS